MQPGDQVDASVDCWSGVCDETVQDVTQNWSDTSSLEAPDVGIRAAVAAESYSGGVTIGHVPGGTAVAERAPSRPPNPPGPRQEPPLLTVEPHILPLPP